ncbi:MAG TPA: M15 family metallopeptidase [Nocardioides sp.]|nr:M15 family metallopeptidase [Nocardioides sp.]
MTPPRRRRVLSAGLLGGALLLAACSGSTTPSPAGEASSSVTDGSVAGSASGTTAPTSAPTSAPTPAPTSGQPSFSRWRLGARPLPLRPDGFGQIRPTPRELRVRRFATRDLLPPPADGRFHSSIGPVTPAIRRRMGESWSPRCPVPLSGLSYLNVSFRGFDGKPHTGELVLAAREAADVVSVFRALFAAGYPIEEMRLPTTADLEAPPTGDGNDTAAMVCRAARGTTRWSAHALGLAIDVNPFLNPYSKGDLVLPELASAYLDRSRTQPGIIHPGSLIVREFARIGWSWGGSWHSLKDYQHFTATGG